jgi:hypothetical protein
VIDVLAALTPIAPVAGVPVEETLPLGGPDL